MKRSVLIILDILFLGAIIFSFVRICKPSDNKHIRFNGDSSKSTFADPDGVIDELYKGNESVQNAIQETSAKLGMNVYYISPEKTMQAVLTGISRYSLWTTMTSVSGKLPTACIII